jgi:hypothetical protein
MGKLLVGAASASPAWSAEPRTIEDAIGACVLEVRATPVWGAPDFDIIKGPGGHLQTFGNDQTRFLFSKCLSRYGLYYQGGSQ